MEGILHIYHPTRRLPLFEFTPRSPTDTTTSTTSKTRPRNILLFIGGLFDTLRSTSYIDDLARLFPRDNSQDQSWTIMQPQLSSASRGFGTSDLTRDVEEIGVCIDFIRQHLYHGTANTKPQPKINIVLLGHSTGCQDIMHYMVSKTPKPKIQGAICQAPVSDREAVNHSISTSEGASKAYAAISRIVENTDAEQYRSTVLPLDLVVPLFGAAAPISVSRFLSLVSPSSPGRPSDEDYFSSDLAEERLRETFGRIGGSEVLDCPADGAGSKEVLFLVSGSDEYMPPHIDKEELVARWAGAGRAGGARVTGRIVGNAKHDLGGDARDARWARLVDMRGAVLEYLGRVVGGVGKVSWDGYEMDKRALEMEEDGNQNKVEKGLGEIKL